jgi:ABC-type dipeptide/oligopeptide/nickel transport system permease component
MTDEEVVYKHAARREVVPVMTETGTVNITGISKGRVTIQATYSGDANNTSSAKTFSRTVE